MIVGWAEKNIPVDPVMKCPLFCFHEGAMDDVKEKLSETGHAIEYDSEHSSWERAFYVLEVLGTNTDQMRLDLAKLDKMIAEEGDD